MHCTRLVFAAVLFVASCGGTQGAQTGGPSGPDSPMAGQAFSCGQAMTCVIDCGSDTACSDGCRQQISTNEGAMLLLDFDNCIADAKLMACGPQCGDGNPDCGPCIQDACRDKQDACQADR